MTDCKQCAGTEQDCDFPDCVGGWEQAYKAQAERFLLYRNAVDISLLQISEMATNGDKPAEYRHGATFALKILLDQFEGIKK